MDTKSEVRVLRLFEVFAELGRSASLSELAERLAIPTSSCFNLVRAVEDRGYLYAAKARGALYPTRRLYDIARTILDNDLVSPAVRARLARLRDDVGETVCLAQRRDTEVVYLDVQESRYSIRFAVSVGETRDIHANSMGKAIVSTMTATETEKLLSRLSYRAHSANTLRSAAALRADLERGRERGWFCNDGETVADALAAAVPVRIGSDWYGMSIVGPATRMRPKLETQLAALFKASVDIQGIAA